MLLSTHVAFAMPTSEFDKGMQKGISYYNQGLYYETIDEIQNFCDVFWYDITAEQQEKALYYLWQSKTNLADYLFNTGVGYYNRGLYYEAQKFFADAIGLYPEYSTSWRSANDYLYNANEKIKEIENVNKRAAKKFNNMGWTYSAYNDEGVHYPGYGSIPQSYRYNIPCFNIVSADADAINKTMWNYVAGFINQEYEYMKSKSSILVLTTDFYEYIGSNTVSIVIEIWNDWDITEYKAFTIDIRNGKGIDNTELISKTGYTQEEFLNILRDAMKKKYESLWKQHEKNSFYWEQYNNTLYKNCNIGIPMYVGNDNHLYAIPNIGSLAGADEYRHIIDTGLTIY